MPAYLRSSLGWALASRLLVLLACYAGPVLWPPAPDPAHWERDGTVLGPLLRWDAGYYLEIAERGYSMEGYAGGATLVAFFPLYPLLVRAVAATGIGAPAAAVLLSHLAFLGAVAVVAVATRAVCDEATARATALLTTFFPWSAFASFPFTEALFLLLAAASLAEAGRERLLAAALLAAAASATRPVGIALAPAIAVVAWRGSRPPWARLAPILAGTGLAAYAAFLGIRFGAPLAFLHAQSSPSWGRLVENPLAILALAPIRSAWHVVTGRATALDLDVWVLLAAAVLLWRERRRLPLPWLVFSAGALALPIASASLMAMPRFVFPVFPAHAAAALVLHRRPRVMAAVLGAEALGLAAVAARYATWRWAG